MAVKTVILAGGKGTRLTEETVSRPKPMVEIGSHPMLEHIMRLYASFGHKDFVVALGYRSQDVRRWFRDLNEVANDLAVDFGTGQVEVLGDQRIDWRVHLIDTGLETMTGGRIKRLADHLGDETFLCTYGDGLCSVDINEVIAFHRSHGRLATVVAVRPPARFGGLRFDGSKVCEFNEKPQLGEGWINGGFFVLEPGVLDYIADDSTIWEREPLEQLTKDGQLMAWKHEDFWHCMDTLRDVEQLNDLWASGRPPWPR